MSKFSITVVILAGGLGKRLRSVISKQPKVLAEVNNRPFLQILLDQLNSAGFQDVVICTGYLGNQIKEKFGARYKKLKLVYSQEKLPSGTGGGLRLALTYIRSEDVLVMNGDSFCDINFNEFLTFHLKKRASASLVLSEVKDIERFGKVRTNSANKIFIFEEKAKIGRGWISAGIYLLKRSLISEIPEGIGISLEKDVFSRWISRNFFGYKSGGKFIDIGTPQSYKRAESFFAEREKNVKRFILLDRDGTIIVEKNYLSKPEDVELIPGVAKALRRFKKMGFGLMVITNQSGVGRGFFDLETLEKIHRRLNNLLAQEGVYLDGIYFCPHTPEDNCLCRKPKVKLIEQAAKKHNFDPKLSFVIGDNKSDIELGKNIGATTILVRTGYGVEIARENKVNPDFVVDSLKEALPVIRDNLKV